MSNNLSGFSVGIKLSGSEAAKVYHSKTDTRYFERERDVYERLGQHPYIARLLRIQGQTIYLERGTCLRQVLRTQDLPIEKKREWIAELACGLEYIHSRNVIHADVNATNAIICKDETNEEHVKWIDFGGSGIDDSEPLAIYDLYNYRTPEPPLPEISIETDIFAFGCTIYEIETGSPPFFNETKEMDPGYVSDYVEERYKQGLFPSTENLRFDSIIKGCWHGRYGSMRDLRNELDLTGARRSPAVGFSGLLLGALFVWRVLRRKVVGVWKFLFSRWLPFTICGG
ncbi:hypothetical protein PV08_06892 [Exophiala spinifera]|uniref:Protein kinase domain-containing protein n=1 Tax=Exophiala spinifera TaxID=91928 RepID=A0A0D1YGJ1_9EURO|nr:uncharacterized protein PV08_06892 [Exophiala spinifera]KIW14111.1 hypothetical protein PV08_06892 [Exophiala spinifera]